VNERERVILLWIKPWGIQQLTFGVHMSLFKLKAISDHQFDVRSAERRRTLFLGHDVAARFGFLLAHLKMCCHIRYSASWREDMLTTHRQTSAEEFLPTRRSLKSLREAARSCEGCDLYRNATQTVFGDGPKEARVALVGEQPGDMEDRQGRPFVGPAGRILDKALAEADIRREDVYVTNAVKHFRWIQRGKRRMHQRPVLRQVIACKPWLRAELAVVQPRLVVCLGVTAAQAMLGKMIGIAKERGKFLDDEKDGIVLVTIHPSAILRQRDKSEQEKEYRHFLADMKLVANYLLDSGR